MNMVRRISLVVVVALLVNLVSPAAVQAGGCQGDCCDPALVPEGGITWDRDDFGRWLQTSHVSGLTRDALRFANESQEVIPMVVTESAYTEWISSRDPLLAEKVERSVVRVRGSDLSAEIIVHDTEGTTAQIDLQSDYVIMSTVWCDYCQKFVAIVIAWALIRWVLDPIGDVIDLLWAKFIDGICGHNSTTTYAYDTTVCPYRPWCQGTLQMVLSDYGTSVELLCE